MLYLFMEDYVFFENRKHYVGNIIKSITYKYKINLKQIFLE